MYPTFGQELYARETARAAELIAGTFEPANGNANGTGAAHGYAALVADTLPHPSPGTRVRLAVKLVQRLSAGNGKGEGPQLFARLLASLPDSETRRELIYYGVTQADRIVGAIARDVLYPYFVDGRLPRGVAEIEFILHNSGRLLPLLTVEPLLTLPFIAWYAERQWDFVSARTIALSMRILRQAGILLTTSLPASSEDGRGATAYTLAPHGLSLAAFVWCLYDEFKEKEERTASGTPLTVDKVEHAGFVRTFVVPPALATARLREAEREGFLRFENSGNARRVLLPLQPEELATRLGAIQG